MISLPLESEFRELGIISSEMSMIGELLAIMVVDLIDMVWEDSSNEMNIFSLSRGKFKSLEEEEIISVEFKSRGKVFKGIEAS